MPTFDNPVADANEAREALRGLAHATRSIQRPGDIYDVLGSLSQAVVSLEQSLHRLAAVHDEPGSWTARDGVDARAGRAASCQVSWELHRAGEIARQVAAAVDHAHQIEARIAYGPIDAPPPPSLDHARSTTASDLTL